MTSDNILDLRDELLAKERELSGIQDLLLQQDGDLRACQDRLGELESTLLLSFSPGSITSKGNEPLCADAQTSPQYPVQRALYESGDLEAPACTAVRVGNATGATINAKFTLITGDGEEDGSSQCPPPSSRPLTVSAHAVTPPDREDGDSSASASPQKLQRCENQQISGGGEAIARLRPTESTTHMSAGGRVLTASSRDSGEAPEPRPAPVRSPSALPSRPTAPSFAARHSLPGVVAADTAPGAVGSLFGSHPRGDCHQMPLSPPKHTGEEILDGRARSMCGVDIFGRRLSRSLQEHGEGSVHSRDDAGYTVSADVENGCRQSACGRGYSVADGQGDTYDDRVARAERRAAAAEDEARAAKDEVERLKSEGREVSRWREVLLDLKDVLKTARRAGKGEGEEKMEERKTDEEPVVGDETLACSPPLENLSPPLHENARDLLADLVAARATGAPASGGALKSAAASTVGFSAGPACAEDNRRAEWTQPAQELPAPNTPERRQQKKDTIFCIGACRNAGATPSMVDSAGSVKNAARAAARLDVVGDEAEEGELASLRKECKTLRIMVGALRDENEKAEERNFNQEQKLLQASLAAVKQEALVATLRRQLERQDSHCLTGHQPSLLTPRRTDARGMKPAACCLGQRNDTLMRKNFSERRSRLQHEVMLPEASTPPSTPPPWPILNGQGVPAESGEASSGSCCRCGGTTFSGGTAAASRSARDRRQDGSGGGSGIRDVEEGSRDPTRHDSCGQPRTPTTDIIRRLLYDSTPTSAPRTAESHGRREEFAAEGNPDSSGGIAQRRCRGQRLFAEGVTSLCDFPLNPDDMARSRRGPAVLFREPLCRNGVVEALEGGWCEASNGTEGITAKVVGVDGEGEVKLPGGVQVHAEKAGHDRFAGHDGGRLLRGELLLRERLLQARTEFSTLREKVYLS